MDKKSNQNLIEGLSRRIFYKMLLAQVALLAIFVLVFCLNAYINKLNTAKQVSEIISTFIINEQKRDIINALSSVTKTNFSAVAFIDEDGENVLSFPPVFSDKHPTKGNFLERTFTRNLSIDVKPKDSNEHVKGQLVFSFNIFDTIYLSLISWAFLTFLLLPLIKRYRFLLNTEFEKTALFREKQAISQVIKEVWHDIGQLIQVLRALQEKSTSMIRSEKDKILNSCEDISQIVEQLKGIEDEMDSYQLLPLLQSIFETEKVKHQSETIEFNFSSCENSLELFSKIQKMSFKRIIANIVDNAAQALYGNTGHISFSLDSNQDYVFITIEDNGQGIKEENLPLVGIKGQSFRKGGHGIGLSSAITKLKTWDAELNIESEFQKGTKVTVRLPRATTPNWALKPIKLQDHEHIVVIDDRKEVFELIQENLRPQIHNKNIVYFKNVTEVKNWLLQNNINENKVFFICDYDLGPKQPNGISVLRLINNIEGSLLMTNHYEDKELQYSCEKYGIKIMAKANIEYLSKIY